MRCVNKSGIIDPTYVVANSAAETALGSLFTVQNSYDIQSGPNDYPGRAYFYKAFGYINSDAAVPGTLTVRMRYGTTNPATSAGTLLASTGAIVVPAALANAVFDLECFMDMDSVSNTSSSGTPLSKMSVNGRVLIQGPANACLIYPFMGNFATPAAAANAITLDTSTAYYSQLTVQFSSALAANNITVTKNWLEGMVSNV